MAGTQIEEGLGALEAGLAGHPEDGWVIVDLDETLWLRNSTETFLDHARPQLVVAALLTLIEATRPWRLLGGGAAAEFAWRDWLRVMVVLVLTPWNLVRWRRDAPEVARAAANRPLLDLLARYDHGRLAAGKVVVASFGFRPIVAPVVAGLLPEATMVAARLWAGWRDRGAGKARMVEAAIGHAALGDALALTDHPENDADLLARAARPHVVRWPDARFEPACAGVYAPFRYTLHGKHPRHNHLRVFFGTDAAALILATAPVVDAPLAAIAASVCLMLSFFTVFEIGYHENDALGAEREAAPILTEARLRHLGTVVEPLAWLAALLFAAPAVWLLARHDLSAWSSATGGDAGTVGALAAAWLVVLVLTRALFAAFNRIDEASRVLLYLPLQGMKGLAIVLVLALPVSAAGVALLLAIALGRWVPYLIYRTAGVRWQTPDRLYQLLLLLVFLAAQIPVQGTTIFDPVPLALVLAWAVFQAKRQLYDALRSAVWLKPRRSLPPTRAAVVAHESAPPGQQTSSERVLDTQR